MQIQHHSPTALNPHPKNPRKHSKVQVSQIANSIETFGFKIPVLVDADNQIICGHGRVMASQQLGLDSIPVIQCDDLTDAQIRAFMIADNKLTENSTWDEQLLGEHFKILSDLDLNFDLEVTGFDYGDIETLIIDYETQATDRDNEEGDQHSEPDTLPAMADIPELTQPGDLWTLHGDHGFHYILCGDATDKASYQQLFETAKRHQQPPNINHASGDDSTSTKNNRMPKASLIFSDPPYNLPAKAIGKVCEKAHGDFAMAAGEMSSKEFTEFLASVFSLYCQHSYSGSIHYLCMDWRHLPEILTAGRDCYTELKNICIWAKDQFGMGSFYRSQHELVLVYKHGKAKHQNHFQLGQHGRTRSNVWHYPSVRSFDSNSGDTDKTEALQLHPTIKPVAMIEDCLRDCSRRGEIVLDGFLGSGSTLIACEKQQRLCYGIELNPRYVDVAIHRWTALTGHVAMNQRLVPYRAGSGKTKEPNQNPGHNHGQHQGSDSGQDQYPDQGHTDVEAQAA